VPTISNFDIATDLKVEFYLAGGASNYFIIGVSKLGGSQVLGSDVFLLNYSLLGGPDVLGTGDAFVWTDLACITAKAELTIGGSVQDLLYFQPEPGRATLTLQSLERDPSYSAAFRPGVQVRVRLVKDAVDQVIWSGVIDSIATTYDVEGNNLMTVTASDNFKRLANTRIASFDSDTGYPGYVTPYEQLELIATAYGTTMSASAVDPGGKIPSEILTDFIPTKQIYDAIQVGLGLFWLDPGTQEFVIVPRPTSSTPPAGTPVIGNNHGDPNHLCMTDIQASATEDTVYNSLKVILESDDTISTLKENQDSIDLYGVYAQDVTLNTTDLTELNAWADKVFIQSPTSFVDSVETLTKDRLGNLTEAAFFTPGQLVGVNYQNGVIDINDYYTVTKVSHYVDSNTWLTTLDTWKEE
jgi:hypothetical protein